MAQLLQFPQPGPVFDSDAAAILISAYDKAIGGLHDKGQPAHVREVIAKTIIELAARGERDSDRLCTGALAIFGLPR